MSDLKDKDGLNKNSDKNIVFAMSQDTGEALEKAGYEPTNPHSPLMYALQHATGSASKKAPRLAFTENPAPTDNYLGLFKSKKRLLPDEVLKTIRVQDHLIASILRARGSMMSLFGHLRKDRFDVGIEVVLKEEFYDVLTPEQFAKVTERVKRFEKLLLNCGHNAGLEHQEKMTLAQFIDIQIQNGLNFGRFATEIIYDRHADADEDGLFPFHRFRPVDVATIYRCVRKGEYVGNNLRETAMKMLESITGEKPKIDIQKLKEDRYAWLQVIDGTPRQAFTHQEMIVYNLFPCTDIEMNGYPVSPLDTVVSSVTTHISIDAYKKLYFQNGRATRGMLVIKSDEVDEAVLNGIKLQFNASVNNVSNSFRTPIFGMGKEDDVQWLPFSGEGLHDADFQFMYDQIARNIMSAFSMSPDELPGYSHLSKGTNSQTLSECFDPSTKILTKDGLFSAVDLLGNSKEQEIEVWTGEKWNQARIFWTGVKPLVETKLKCNLTLKTSPDHRFRVVDENGQLSWRKQSELKIGDTVLVNGIPVESSFNNVLYYNEKQINSEMMEVLGWLSGDGSVSMPRKRIGGQITLFYHHDKELDVRERHLNILNKFGLNAKCEDRQVSDEEANSLMKKYDFKSIAPFRRNIKLYDSNFVRWVSDEGFIRDGKKRVPESLYTMSTECRYAFLRGLFSADGHITKNGDIILTVQDKDMRDDVRELLISLGIRTNSYKGVLRKSFGKKEFSHKISIKDRNEFLLHIGFLQQHKKERQKDKNWTIGDLPQSLMSSIATLCLDGQSEVLTKIERDQLVSAKGKRRNISKDNLIFLAEKCNVTLPEWFINHHFEQIVSIKDCEKSIEMVDVEVFNDEHAFILNGVQVHNSNNEFKLTAARDTGLRPLVRKLQTFFNQLLFPLIDPLLAKVCEVKFCGLDAQSIEQESTRLQQNMPTHMTYSEVLREVDKDPVSKLMAGDFPFNERYQIIIDKYKNVGEIMTSTLGDSSAFVDPLLKYKRDPFHLQFIQLMAQINPTAVQAYFAPRPFAIDMLKMLIQDELDENEEN